MKKLIVFYTALLIISAVSPSFPAGGQSLAALIPENVDTDAQWQAEADIVIRNLTSDYSLSWKDILQKLEDLEKQAKNRFGEVSLSHAFVLHKMGVVYSNLGDNDAAIQHYERALRIREEMQPRAEQDLSPLIARGYNNIGNRLLKTNRPYEAIEYFSNGLSVAERIELQKDDPVLVQHLHLLIARGFKSIGDFDNALKYYERVIDIANTEQAAEEEVENVEHNRVRALSEKGALMANQLGRPLEGEALLKQALRVLKKYPRPPLLADVQHNLGLAYQMSENYAAARDAYLKSIDINKSRDSWYDLALSYNNLGVVLKKLNALDRAEQFLMDALHFFRDTLQMTSPLSLVYDNLGDIACLRGAPQEGLRYDLKAVEILVPSYQEGEQLPSLMQENLYDKEGLLISLRSIAGTIAEMYEDPKELARALSTYEAADQLIDMMRAEYRPEASKASLVDKSKPIYEEAIRLCWRLNQKTGDVDFARKAFQFSEKSRAIILLEAVRNLKASFELPPELARSEQELNLRKNYFEKQYALAQQAEPTDEEEIASLRKALLDTRREHREILTEIEAEYSNYYNLKFDAGVIDAEELSRQLKEDQALLEYFVGDEDIFVFLVRPEKVVFEKISKTFPMEDWIGELQQSVQKGDRHFFEPGYRLYEQLLLPLESQLPSQLTIVPDGMLGYVAFDMLPRQMPDLKDFYYRPFRDYLLHHYQISYQYSATLAGESSRLPGKASQSFLGVAPEFDHAFSVAGASFGPLEWNIPAVRQGADLFGGTALTGSEAGKISFLEQAPHHRIIQLATHALADDEAGELSFILFGTREQDVLHAKDLYSLRLSADLVVLSACQGGTGELLQGEGIISLARGFIYAGCTSVLPTLWSVDDEATQELITAFYQELEQGTKKDEALRQAKLQYLDKLTAENDHKAHPYYWASFIPVGQMQPIDRVPSFGRHALLLLGLLSVGLGSWWWYRRHSA